MYLKVKKISLDELIWNQTTPRYDHKVQVKYVLKNKGILNNYIITNWNKQTILKSWKVSEITLIGKYNKA